MWKTRLQTDGIKWHDHTENHPIIQLGYPLYSKANQLQTFLDQLENKILRHMNILKGRYLSIQGASAVTNSLLLSKLWHVLRVVPAPTTWLDKMKQYVRSFLLNL